MAFFSPNETEYIYWYKVNMCIYLVRRVMTMHENIIPLNNLPLGRKAIVKDLISDGNIRRRMLDLGIIHNTEVEALQKSPSGDPVAYSIRGTVIALRSEEASKIMVEEIL